ncbi:hypothetical protein [Methylocystis echinoides]|uniref:hypothetical protein n=1 Tax=Methylocystis echinoides TaxID=29468 RepID=UPI0034309D12
MSRTNASAVPARMVRAGRYRGLVVFALFLAPPWVAVAAPQGKSYPGASRSACMASRASGARDCERYSPSGARLVQATAPQEKAAILSPDRFVPFSKRQPFTGEVTFAAAALGDIDGATIEPASETREERRRRLKNAPFIEY